jgi:hypothetical protein
MNLPRSPGTRVRTSQVPPEEPVFTAYLRALATPAGPGPDLYRRVRDALASALGAELARRGLWRAPPTFLGVYGWTEWTEAGALDELVSACHGHNFVTRRRSLTAQLAVKKEIEGLVLRNVRLFVHERQKEHDPLGYQAYEVLKGAVEMARDEGWVTGMATAGRIDNETVICFAPGAGPPSTDRQQMERRREIATAFVASCNGELLPDLVTARGRARKAVLEELARRLPRLADEGIESLSFRELLGPFRRDLRERWAALMWQGSPAVALRESVETAGEPDDEAPTLVRVLSLLTPPPPPDQAVIERQAFRRLTRCVATRIEQMDLDELTRGYLETFWQYLRTAAVLGEPVPSQRKLAQFLKIPRERLPALYEAVAGAFEHCRRTPSGPRTEPPAGRDANDEKAPPERDP